MTNRSIRNCRFRTRNSIVIVLVVTTIFSGVLQVDKIKNNMQRIQDKLRSLQVSERWSDATEWLARFGSFSVLFLASDRRLLASTGS